MRALFAAGWLVGLGAWSAPAASAPRLVTVDGEGVVAELAASRASIERTPPARAPRTAPDGDPDALRYLVIAPVAELPRALRIESLDAAGAPIGRLARAPLVRVDCPAAARAAAGEACATTAPIRVAADAVDASHPLVKRRSLVGALGGALRVSARGVLLASVRVAGPRRTPAGPIDRLRGRLRFVAVRESPGGALPVGANDDEARAVARRALERVNALWGACGIEFGPPAELWFTVADPPRPFLLSIGCGHGLPASGGELTVRVDGAEVAVAVDAAMRPAEAARRLAAALARAGLSVAVFDNPPIAAGAFGSADLVVRRADGAFAELSWPAASPLSSDATLSACIGYVNLEDGLSHFGDVDASAGTLEERTLIRALDDADPATIDVYLIGAFSGGGRIGESFITSDGGLLRNLVIVDRAGLAASASSSALAHELGHVLLDDPGHPDDFGSDHPERLMDSDAADGGAFGPRRLALEECARALVQSGPDAPLPLLTAVPTATAELSAPLSSWYEPAPSPWPPFVTPLW